MKSSKFEVLNSNILFRDISMKNLTYSLFLTIGLIWIISPRLPLKWPWDDPLSAPCEGIPVTFHDNVHHDLSNNTKWSGEMYVMTGIGHLQVIGIQIRNMKMVFNIYVHLALGNVWKTNDENLWFFLFG